MALYRIHEFDARGHVTGTHVIDCLNDEEAIAVFGRSRKRQPMTELWLESRCVKRTVATLGALRGRMNWPRG